MNVFDLCAKLTLDKSEYDKGLNNASSMVSKVGSGIASGLKTVATVTATAVGAGATAVTAVTKQAVDAYASYEQLTGGVWKLFSETSLNLQEFADSQGKSIQEVSKQWLELTAGNRKVLNNADEAYRTAGMSANEYMETVTSFSASLIKSLDGDTSKAADYADRAIRDMSDNANTFGSSLESIQNAYQGFAKENYTMLDNLKLGYGGTKEGMQALIKDASQLTEVQKELGVTVDANSLSYANIVDAISVMQTSMKIAGTTEKEAMGTIEGSMNMLKASWENVVTGIGGGSDELEVYIDNFIESVTAVATNIQPVVERALTGIGTLIEQVAPIISETIPVLINDVLPKIVEAGAQLVSSLVQALMDNAGTILDTGVDLLNRLIDGITQALPELGNGATTIIEKLIEFIKKNAPKLIQGASQLIGELGKGLGSSFPEMIPDIVDLVLDLVESIVDNADSIIDGALALILGLADGLIESMPRLLERIPKIIEDIVYALTTNAPNILAGALELILALANGLIECLPKLIMRIPTIINAIVEGLTDGIADMMQVGVHLVDGLWDGIKKKWEDLKNNVKNLGKNLVQEVKNIFDIHSPSRVFKQIGELCVEGLEIGSNDMFGDGGLTAKVTADVADKTTGNNDILALLESYLPSIASGQNIYLDGDTLVSNTAKRMDLALGRLSARRA